MATTRTIPVRVDSSHTVELSADALVIRFTDLPAVIGQRRNLLSDQALEFDLEPFEPMLHRNQRGWALRWASDLLASSSSWTGGFKFRCSACRRKARLGLRGCHRHNKQNRTMTLSPQAGKVFGHVSTTRLYGLSENTSVLFQTEDGSWEAGVVQAYPLWRDQERKQERLRQRECYKQRQKIRRRQERVSKYELILSDPFNPEGLEASGPTECC